MKRQVCVVCPAGDQVSALGAESLFGLLRYSPHPKFEFYWHGYSMGPYVHLNLTAGFRTAFNFTPDPPLVLRVDSDMSWDPCFARRFFDVADELLEGIDPEKERLIIGGVYVRRQAHARFVPCVKPLVGPPPGDEASFPTWCFSAYLNAWTSQVAACGGGFQLFTPAVWLWRCPRCFEVTETVGEDYGICEHVRRSDKDHGDAPPGRVVAVWPSAGHELYHVNGSNRLGLSSYFALLDRDAPQWRLAGVTSMLSNLQRDP